MDKDRVKGAIDDAAGRVKRQVGEWTGDTGTQAEGAAQQVKGKAEKAWGTVKDAALDEKEKEHEHADKSELEKKLKVEQEKLEKERAEREHAGASHR